ncbi:peptidyl-prolyl cis-trans isomerase C [Bradyrhizobium japonicum]|jgi:peptidyl-prolyl cis-trans isomerase C|uniref:Parvulin-like PPIase n=1 Tax=Bradyrhizobium elkanii TaxID=29448 RepID=A0ABV4FBK8_BRAEL|nr:peptidylprolyl isomerase [Bradyrhizobium elkanii]MBP2432264.1 peptidyl-prolyl cis-trans isomerase C [Bradyrhizobium elkanii]MCP1734416.1 peptidyl-prolyl cis-trans isomerase C [Bradyrhizobium elkanii]MCP1752210.1 peptidyl-prolyl cis-trans isomerase C [Bradyrhizobium elkanii]MCP1977983.1 peptidyl-prolyl cis-trans isomerase C [Bradyrhizobium elkanii]MCS3569754.1 peptidyl-prolyl cis-trans isomerase C [Bradyrhizobium elkanii]
MDCSLTDSLPKPKTISVNGTVIPREAIAREVQNHPAEKPILAWQAAARALVVRELLLQEARRLEISAEPLRDAEGRSETPEEAAMRALIEREVVTPEPDDASCLRYYEQNQRRFRSGDLYEAAHILIATPRNDAAARSGARETAEKVLSSVLEDPALFDQLARTRSDCRTSAENGGHLGQLTRGQTIEEFEVALARMDEGELAIVETRYGFHIVRLDRHAPGQVLPFELARERIADYLATSVQHRSLAQYVAVLAGRAEITGIALAGASSPLLQ